mmetsp:Transcript_62663/g.103352  ORF Transcript_62663/g.103352 Transcript_62663/m.103352 type:complete len:346 (+) Transcript_62663:2100-3137(+)
MAKNIDPHPWREQACVSRLWHALQQHFLNRLLCGQCQSCQGVHDQIQPEQLHGSKRAFVRCVKSGPDESNQYPDNIDSNLELEEFFDVVVHVAAPHNGLDHTPEVVIQQHNIRGRFGNVGPSLHGESDISHLQRRAIIRAITSHGHNHASLLQQFSQGLLVLRAGAGQHLQLVDNVLESLGFDVVLVCLHLLHQFSELFALHCKATLLEDATLLGNALRSQHVVASHHTHHDSRLLTLLHGTRDLRANGIRNAKETNGCQFIGFGLIFWNVVGMRGFRNQKHAVSFTSHVVDLLIHGGTHCGCHWLPGIVAIDKRSTLGKEDLGCAFNVNDTLATLQDDCGHAFL